MEVMILVLLVGGSYWGERRFHVIEKFILALRLRRRIILYRSMRDEMDALRRDILHRDDD